MPETRIGNLPRMIRAYIDSKLSLMLHGAPGIGKSHVVIDVAKELAKELKLKYVEGTYGEGMFGMIDVRASQLDPSDLRGIPYPEGDKTKWLIPNWLPTSGQGVLFFDEINLAPPSVQAAFYQLINDRKLGDYVVPEGWSIVAAGNRGVDKANIFPMSAPLKNRFGHVDVAIPSQEEWQKWATQNDVKSDILAFMGFKPSYLFKFDSNNKDNAFPTPRSWYRASVLTKHLTGKNPTELQEEYELVASQVGEGVALEYQAFVKLKDKIDIKEVLEHPEKAKKITAIDEKFSLTSGLAEKYKQDKKLANKVLCVIEHINGEEFGVFLLRLMRDQRPTTFRDDIMACPQWKVIYSKFNKFIF